MPGMAASSAPVRLAGPPGSAAVAAGSAEVVDAALSVLSRGGSAADAAVAGALTAVMAEPVLASLGGGGFLMHAEPGESASVLDFFVDVPGLQAQDVPSSPDVRTVVVDFRRTGSAAGSSEQVFHGGWGTVGVPGCLDGLVEAHRRWGVLPFFEVAAPAVGRARDGVVLSAGQRMFLHLVTDLLNLTDESRAVFAQVERSGRYVNGQYANLLDAMTAGAVSGIAADIFADRLLDASRAGRGLLTLSDLQHYAPVLREPLELARAGARVWTNPPPSVGGSIVVAALERIPHAHGHLDAGAVAQVLADATTEQRRRGTVRKGTTHLSVVDARGAQAALTLSNGSGSGTVVPHWGVAMNNMLGEEDLRPADGHPLLPGERMGSMMAPTIVETSSGARIALGTGGSERIRSAVLTTLLRLIDEGRELPEAVAAPRIHASEAGPIHVEPGWSAADLDRLNAASVQRGWPGVEQWSDANLFFGGVHAVQREPDGVVEAVGDRRRTGSVGVLLPDGSDMRA